MTSRILGLAVALTLGVASLCAAETRTIDKTFPLSASGTVTLDAHNGLIEIRTWDRPDVAIHVQIESRGSSSIARRRVAETTVDIDGSPSLVSITLRQSDWGLLAWLTAWDDSDTSPDIHYTVTAPRSARWRIRDHNAKADIRDVSAALDLATHNGSVWIANQNGPLSLAMHNGDAHVTFASFHTSQIASHNGSADLTLPASSKFEVRSSGHHLRVNSDFPVVNGGGQQLRLTTHNGSFGIHSR